MRVSSTGRHVIDEVREVEERWHYAGGRRDLRLDLLRGFAALAMIADHVGGEHSWLTPVTGGNRFLVSAAEAFVFISGAVMGIVYHDVVRRGGIFAGVKKAVKRARDLYALTVALTLAFASVGVLFGLWWRPDITWTEAPSFVIDVALLRRTMFLTDIPLMYTLLVLAASVAIVLLSLGGTLALCAVSVAIWGLWQLEPGAALLPWQIEGNAVFFFPAWQMLFVAGLVIGWHRNWFENWISHLSRPALFLSLTAVTVTILFLYVAQITSVDAMRNSSTIYALAFDKADVPAGRLAVFALLGTFAFTATTLLWDPMRRVSGWLLLPLGQNALTAYSVHIGVVAVTTKLTLTVFGTAAPGAAWATALALGGVGFVWLFVVLEPKVRSRAETAISARFRRGGYDGKRRRAAEVPADPKGVALT